MLEHAPKYVKAHLGLFASGVHLTLRALMADADNRVTILTFASPHVRR